MSRATFPAAARMHRPTEFAAALAGKRIARGAFFIVTAKFHSVLASNSYDLPKTTSVDLNKSTLVVPKIARLGLIMAKRFAVHASTRNALKRVVRESFRAQRHDLPVADFVVRLNMKIHDMTLSELKYAARQEVDSHFLKARRK